MMIVKWALVVPRRETICLENYWSFIKDTKTKRWDAVCKRGS